MDFAVLIDGAFLRRKFHTTYKKDITAQDVECFANKLIEKLPLLKKDSYRIYFYDCRPCDEEVETKITKTKYNFSTTLQYKNGIKLLNDIRNLSFFAVREGKLSFNGWMLKENCYEKNSHTDDDFRPDLKQKGVDIKIGLDIAWIAYNGVTENIILVTADSDFVPAIKVARRNGIFVHLFTLGHLVKSELKTNADVCHDEILKSF